MVYLVGLPSSLFYDPGIFVVFEQVCFLPHASDGSEGLFELNSYLPPSTTTRFVVFIYQFLKHRK